MTVRQALTYVEADVPLFSSNSPDVGTQTFRWAVDTIYLPRDIDAIPSIKEVRMTPGLISLGETLGQRTKLEIRLTDHRHKFASEAWTAGTFWGKFRARYGLTLYGYPLRVIQGYLGQALADMEVRHFIIDSTDGPSPSGEFRIIGRDTLKLADDDKSQAPRPSDGFLVANITNVATTATLSPSGIGGSYPASGVAAIGGSEVVSFTRSGDALTLTRGQFNTTAVSHNSGDRVQLCLSYSGMDVADIIYDLLSTYAGISTSLLPLSTWKAETAAFLGVVYTALVAEPTGVTKLLNELIQQAALAVWWDDVAQQVRLQVLRQVPTNADLYDDSYIMEDSLEVTEQPTSRLSQVYTYFGKINPLVNDDQINNYRSTALTTDAGAERLYGSPSIKKVYCRWIPSGGRTTAQTLNGKQLGRYVNPPRRFRFSLFRYAGKVPVLGVGYQLQTWLIQTVLGGLATVPIQVVQVDAQPDRYVLEAQEVLWTPYGVDVAPGTRSIIFDANENDINLRTRHDQLYPTPTSGNVINAVIYSGVILGSSSKTTPALDIGTWPAGVTVNLTVMGRVQGAGGEGGSVHLGGGGGNGGTALYTRQAINLILNTGSGQVWGGGGGGNAIHNPGPPVKDYGGGGGAGQLPGAKGVGYLEGSSSGNPDGYPGTTEAGGRGAYAPGTPPLIPDVQLAGNGGGPGLPGQHFGSGSAAGTAGSSVDGISHCTVTGTGDRRGAQVN
jgi:hypothetical protein